MQRTRSVTIVFPTDKIRADQRRLSAPNADEIDKAYHSRHRRLSTSGHCSVSRKDDTPDLIDTLQASTAQGSQPKDFCQFLPPALQPKEYLPLLYRLQSCGRISEGTEESPTSYCVGDDNSSSSSCELSPKALTAPSVKSPEQIIDECGGKAQFIELMRNLYHR